MGPASIDFVPAFFPPLLFRCVEHGNTPPPFPFLYKIEHGFCAMVKGVTRDDERAARPFLPSFRREL